MAKLKYYDFCCTGRCEVGVTKAGVRCGPPISRTSRLRRYRLAGGAARRVYNEVSGNMHISF
ncbi:hypothetical protein J6590_043149 [Homalodisca vitripennis]|nr:hypothetical protein J6590_043149 [Homalodisca vitripennis]